MAIKWKITDDRNRPQKRAKDFAARLGRIPPRVRRRINQANEKSAEELAAMMVRLVPEDERDLERSITYYELTGPQDAGIVWRVTAGNQKAYYARFVEFGAGIGTVAQPFFYPSYRALRRIIRRRQIAAFNKGIRESATT